MVDWVRLILIWIWLPIPTSLNPSQAQMRPLLVNSQSQPFLNNQFLLMDKVWGWGKEMMGYSNDARVIIGPATLGLMSILSILIMISIPNPINNIPFIDLHILILGDRFHRLCIVIFRSISLIHHHLKPPLSHNLRQIHINPVPTSLPNTFRIWVVS